MLRRCLLLALAAVLLMPYAVSGQQDYTQYEVQYLKVLPGHAAQFEAKLAEHNQNFHSEGPYTATVDYLVTGPYSGQYLWVMGPGTFTTLDDRPAGDPHDSDWAEVLAHAEGHSNTYWRRNDDLSTPLPASEAAAMPILRTRFFEVADNALFVKTQEQIEETVASMGITGRSFYRRQFAHRDGRDWALVTLYENWAALDEAGGNFRAAFIEVHGQTAWSVYQDERAEALVGTEDEYRQRMPALGGGRRAVDSLSPG